MSVSVEEPHTHTRKDDTDETHHARTKHVPKWRSGAVTGRRGYPPRLRNGSPRRQAVTLWYPPRTIENESRLPGKAAGRGVIAVVPSRALAATPLPVRSPLPSPPHWSLCPLSPLPTSRVHYIPYIQLQRTTLERHLALPRARSRAPIATARLLPRRSPPPPLPRAVAPSPPCACASSPP